MAPVGRGGAPGHVGVEFRAPEQRGYGRQWRASAAVREKRGGWGRKKGSRGFIGQMVRGKRKGSKRDGSPSVCGRWLFAHGRRLEKESAEEERKHGEEERKGKQGR